MGLRHHELEVRQPLGADRGQLVFGLPHREGRMFHIDVILDSERHRLFLFEDLAAWRTGRLAPGDQRQGKQHPENCPSDQVKLPRPLSERATSRRRCGAAP
jgi:hypothetical protein